MKLDYLKGEMQACSLCGGAEFELLKANDRYAMRVKTVGCSNCGLIQSNPRPNEENISRFYQLDYRRFYQNIQKPSQSYIGKTGKDLRLAYTANYLMNEITKNNSKTLLDVGCSEGALFKSLLEEGYQGELFGVEPNTDFANFAHETTGATIVSNLSQIERTFDAVILSHVLEHSLDPQMLLSEIFKRLNVGGFLYIDVPDADQYRSLADLHVAHVVHFTSRTLQAMASSVGFSISHIESHNPPHHPKSLRLIGVKQRQKQKIAQSSKLTETDTWARIRRIRVWRYLARRRLSQVSVLRMLYRLTKATRMR